jgi:hypothetical protein
MKAEYAGGLVTDPKPHDGIKLMVHLSWFGAVV